MEFDVMWLKLETSILLTSQPDHMPDFTAAVPALTCQKSGHSIPLTSRWETLWFVASLQRENWAAQQPAEERSPSRRFVSICHSDSSPWLSYHTSRGEEKKKKKKNPLCKDYFTIYSSECYCLAIARISGRLLLGELLDTCAQQAAQSSLRTGLWKQCRLHQLCSPLFRTVRLPAGWFHITVDGAGGQCRDNLMKTKRALSLKPLVATTGAQLKRNQMALLSTRFSSGLCNAAGGKSSLVFSSYQRGRHF